MTLLPPDDEREAVENNDEENSYSFSHATSSITFLLVIVFQVLGALQICISGNRQECGSAGGIFSFYPCGMHTLCVNAPEKQKSFVLELLGYFCAASVFLL